jgi:hypothetical protein
MNFMVVLTVDHEQCAVGHPVPLFFSATEAAKLFTSRGALMLQRATCY